MKNSEKFKTAQERENAFWDFCEKNVCLNGCPLYKSLCDETRAKRTNSICHFTWLDLEAEEEKPLPCPFCGGDNIKFTIVEDASDQYMSCPTVFCCKCGATFELDWHRASDLGTTMTDEHKRQLLSRWNNRVERSV